MRSMERRATNALDGRKSNMTPFLACTTVIGNWGDKVRVRAMPSAANPNNAIGARMD